MNEAPISQSILYPDNLFGFLNEDTYLNFLDNIRTRKDITYISLTFPAAPVDPLAFLELPGQKNEFQFFWEMPEQELAISAGSELISIQASGSSRFEDVHDQIDAIQSRTAEYSAVSHSHSGLTFLGGFSFHDENDDPLWKPFGAASFAVPEWMVIKKGNLCVLTITLDISGCVSADQINRSVRAKLHSFSELLSLNRNPISENQKSESFDTGLFPNHSPDEYNRWIDSVKKAKEYIRNGYFEKIVLARACVAEAGSKLLPARIVNRLRSLYPNCYSFLIGKKDAGTFIGCSPERLAAFDDRLLHTEALAGSIERGVTATDDTDLARQLLDSQKNTSEHHYVIKAIEQKLKPFALNMNRNALPGIKKYTNVQHLSTPITAQLRTDNNRFSILKALHPTPAVGGYPWNRAARFLQQLEHFNRGWYAGPVGWLNGKGNGEFAVAIRSGLIRDTTAHIYAGCGIVADSDPDAEWRETNLKLMPMLSALRYD